jgi:hypothetical protein
MSPGRRAIAQWWQDYHKQVMAIGVVAWVVCITLIYHKATARRVEGGMASILPVGGLPVT